MIFITGYTKDQSGLMQSYMGDLSPNPKVIDHLLSSINNGSGQIKFIIQPEPAIGVASLEIQADKNNYLIMIFEYDENEVGFVRTYIDRNASHEQIEILGNFWDRGLVCSSFNYVRDAIHEFIDTGDVKQEELV